MKALKEWGKRHNLKGKRESNQKYYPYTDQSTDVREKIVNSSINLWHIDQVGYKLQKGYCITTVLRQCLGQSQTTEGKK